MSEEELENCENPPLAECEKAYETLPETYRPDPNISILEDTTNHLFPIMRRRKVLAVGISLLCFGTCLFAIEKIPPLYRTSAQLTYSGQDEAYINTQMRYLKIAPITLLSSLNGSNSQDDQGDTFKSPALESAEPFGANSTSTEPLSPDRLRLSHIPGSSVIEAYYYDQNAQNSKNNLNRFLEKYVAHINAKNGTPEVNKRAPQPPNENPQYIAAKTSYLTHKSLLSAFISKDGSINLHGNKHGLERLRSDILNELDGKKRRLEYIIESLSMRYGQKHPKMVYAKQALDTINSQIKQEREALLGRLIDDYITAKNKYDALDEIHGNKPEHVSSDNQPPIPTVQLTSPVQLDDQPVTPDKSRLIGYSLLLSLFLSIMVPLFVERRRKTFICGRQLSHYFGLLCYALIPRTSPEQNKNLADFVLDNPSDTLVEAIRSLRLNIKLKSQGSKEEDKVVLVTSSKADEGKSMVCAWLARLAAKSGERVLLIDGNLREPSIHEALNGRNTLSLVEYLTGKTQLNEVIDKSDPSGLHVIYGRSIPNSVLELLSSQKMGDLLRDVRKDYDLIVIDTPPCLMNADARALSPHADLLLYMVSWNKTKRDVIHKGLSQFLSFAKIRTALVLSNIDVKRHIEFGYGEAICDDES